MRLMVILQCIFISLQPILSSGVHPKNIDLRIGDSVNITCSINPDQFPGADSTSMYFEESDTQNKVPKNHTIIINDTAIMYMLKNAKAQNRDYHCKSDNNVIATSHVAVGTAPTNVTNFYCRRYDYTYMTCNFTIPENKIPPTYKLSYIKESVKNGYKNNVTKYLSKVVKDTNCEIRIEKFHGFCNLPAKKNEDFTFHLVANNSMGSNDQYFEIKHSNDVYPSRPNVFIQNITTNSAVLIWNLNNYESFSFKNTNCTVHISCPNINCSYSPINRECRANQTFIVELKDLPHAYHEYLIGIRVGIIKRNSKIRWSEMSEYKFKTKASRPYALPRLDVGSFYIKNDTAVRIYWQEVSESYKNGPNFTNVFMKIRRNNEIIHLLPIVKDSTSAVFPWSSGYDYDFEIKTKNDVGDSLNSTRFVLPKLPIEKNYTSISPQCIKAYIASNRTYSISWVKPINSTDLVSYTVFWCQSKPAITNECQGSLQFQQLPNTTTSFHTEPQMNEKNIAVSANYVNYSSGMHWALRNADISKDLMKMQPDIVDYTSTTLTVQWSKPTVCLLLFDGYVITYCEEISSQCKNKTVEKTATKQILTDLRPDSKYTIKILYMYSNFTRGAISNDLSITTREDAPSPPLNLRCDNITRNSVTLSWRRPNQRNGKIRSYIIKSVNETDLLDENPIVEHDANNQEIKSFKWEKLNTFTNYAVYIVARTVKDSDPSNLINFTTSVGIPSKPLQPTLNISTDKVIDIQWLPPETPSGRIEFYEINITTSTGDQILEVVRSTKCTIQIPDSNRKYTFWIRAVNVNALSNETDPNACSGKIKNMKDVKGYTKNRDKLFCKNQSTSRREQHCIINRYKNTKRYELFRSEWTEALEIDSCNSIECSAITMLLILFGIIIIVIFIGVMLKTMKSITDIKCELPGDLSSSRDYEMKPLSQY